MLQQEITYEFRRHNEDPFGHDSPLFNGLVLGHIALHNSPNANAGDTILPQAIRKIFDVAHGQFGWQYLHLWDKFTTKKVKNINKQTHGLVIGGGGFIIKDQWGANIRRSGWSWNISMEELKAIEVPFCLFAVGYNRFRHQEDFDQNFYDHINLTVEKACFVGLRNTGSMERVKSYLSEQYLKDKLKLQYCPTTSCYQLWPEYGERSDAFESGFSERTLPVLALNFAGDRLDMRFGDRLEAELSKLALTIKKAEHQGWKIVVVSHKQIDRKIETYLDKAQVSYIAHDLTFANHFEIMAFYSEVDLVIGMRGHSQMIPFGLRKPILSIISHNKMAYFLEDLKHMEWGVDIDNVGWDEALLEKINIHGLVQRETTLQHLKSAQETCWTSSIENVSSIVKTFQLQALRG